MSDTQQDDSSSSEAPIADLLRRLFMGEEIRGVVLRQASAESKQARAVYLHLTALGFIDRSTDTFAIRAAREMQRSCAAYIELLSGQLDQAKPGLLKPEQADGFREAYLSPDCSWEQTSEHFKATYLPKYGGMGNQDGT